MAAARAAEPMPPKELRNNERRTMPMLERKSYFNRTIDSLEEVRFITQLVLQINAQVRVLPITE